MTWLRADEAAAWLGVSEATVRVIAHREQWRRARHGRRVLYLLEDVGATREARAW